MTTIQSSFRKTNHLYRDCLRLIEHIAGKNSKKSIKLKYIIGNEFRKNSRITDQQAIEALKSQAIRGLANYLMLESTDKDLKFKVRADSFIDSEKKHLDNMDSKDLF